MHSRFWLAATLALLFLSACIASADTVTLIGGETKLEYGGELEYSIPPPDDYKSVLLTISTRIDYPSAAGSTYVMSILLNGRPVTPEINRRARPPAQ